MKTNLFKITILSIFCILISTYNLSAQKTLNISSPRQAADLAKKAGAPTAYIAKLNSMSQAEFEVLKNTPQYKQAMQKYMDDASINSSVLNTSIEEDVEVVEIDAATNDDEIYELNAPRQEIFEAAQKASKDIFGRNVFSNKNLTFAPSDNTPTPPSYKLSSGDNLMLNYWGAAEGRYSLKVSRDGFVSIPNIGIIPVAGLTMDQAENMIRNQMSSAIDGLNDGSVDMSISLGGLRSINVNIVGEALVPGSYVLNSMSTVFNALHAAGGVNDIGSLRNIKVYRSGKLKAVLDAYDYLINGNQDVNINLEDNDVIIVEPNTNMVNISGLVKRPAIFELKSNETIEDLINYAGGFSPTAYTEKVLVERSSNDGLFNNVYTVDSQDFDSFNLKDGDIVLISPKTTDISNKISITGAVWTPGIYAIDQNIQTIKDLIKAANGIKPEAFGGRIHILRLLPNKEKEIIAINLTDLTDGKIDDIDLMPNDRVIIKSTQQMIEPQTITTRGYLIAPDTISYHNGMTLQDVITLSGGFKRAAALSNVEIARQILDPYATEETQIKTKIFNFRISPDLSLQEGSSEFAIEPFDIITVRRSPASKEQESVYIDGEVIFPGAYIKNSNDMKLVDLVNHAGGTTSQAYKPGAYIYRMITEGEKLKLESRGILTDQLKTYTDVKSNKNYYAIAIDLEQAMKNPNGPSNITLESGDRLVIPTKVMTVRISGAVQYPNYVNYIESGRVKDYIQHAGGFMKRAYKKKIYIINVNGSVNPAKKGTKVNPGSEIVVPLKPENESLSTVAIIAPIVSSFVTTAALIISTLK